MVEETRDAEFGITKWILSNGVKVILKPTTFKNDEIIFKAFAPGGSSLYSDNDYQTAANASAIISSNGVGNYDSDQLEKYLQGKQFSVAPFIGERYQGLSGLTTNNDLENALQMAYAVFSEPRKDSAIFEGIIARAKAGMANRADDPGSVFSDTVSAVLGNYNVRRTGPSLQKINELDLDKAYRIYKERFADASNFTFTFVGSFNPEALKPLVEKYIGSLPSTNTHEKARELNIHIPFGKIEKTVYKGSEPKASVLLVFSGPYEYNLDNNTCLKALKEALEIRLLQRLREDESGVYSPGVSVDCEKFPKENYTLSVQFGCAPQNVDKLIASTLDEINKLKIQGPPQENIDKWRAEDKTSMEPQLKTNSFWLNYIKDQLQDEEDLNDINNYPAARDKVSVENVKNMAKKYLSGNNYIRLVLLPQKK